MKKIVSYKISRYSENLPKTELEECVRRGFALWEKQKDLKFIQVNQHQNLTLEFVKDHPEFCNAQIQAYTPSPQFIIFNDKFYWSIDGKPKEIRNEFGQPIRVKTGRLPALIAHEFGHVVGLEHSNNKVDIMFYPSDFNITKFSRNDVRRIKELELA